MSAAPGTPPPLPVIALPGALQSATQTALPNDLPRPAGEREQLERAWAPPKGWRIITSVNNSHVGLFYIGTALAFFVLAGVLGLLMRAQLALPGNTLLSPSVYNQVFTMHGTVMMFLFAVPVVEAIAVFLLPNMLGARDLPFPRLSAYAFWAYAIGGAFFFITIFFGASPDGGWFMYPPLTGKEHSPGIGADFWLLGIGFIEISAIAGAVELIVGILMTRTPGMTLSRMPVFAWAMLVVGVMIVFAFPAIIAGTALLEMERAFDWPFFIAGRGGDPVLWQHLFWFFGHPEVYIIFLPAAGLVSMLVPVLARTPLVGERAVIGALIAVGLFSFALWAHHMFTAGLGLYSLAFVSAASLAVAVPSAIQVFGWIGTLWRGQVRMTTSALFVLGFLALFVLGGLTGVMVAVLPFDRQAHDSYFIVAHLHYVLIGGMVFPMFAAFYHWLPLVKGQRLSERVGRWVVGLMFAGFNIAFLPMHVTGLLGMPRRVHSYSADAGWTLLNLVSTIGAFMLAAGIALFFVDLWRWMRRPEQEPGDPWGAATLEWLPAGNCGLYSMPQVNSNMPLWTQPGLREEVLAGAHWLPGNPTGGREALITGMRDGKPRYLLMLPGDGWMPIIAAIGTAGFFLLLTVGWIYTAWAFGIAALVAIWAWLWGLDRASPIAMAPIGRDVSVPVGRDGRFGHAHMAMWLVLIVDGSVFASFAFAHVHVSMAAAVCPPPGASLPGAGIAMAGIAAWLMASACIEVAARRAAVVARARGLSELLAAATLIALAAFAIDFDAQRLAGLSPRSDAWSATIAALLAYEGFHGALILFFGAFAFARARAGLLSPNHRIAVDLMRLMVHASTVQAIAASALVQWLPGWMS